MASRFVVIVTRLLLFSRTENVDNFSLIDFYTFVGNRVFLNQTLVFSRLRRQVWPL